MTDTSEAEHEWSHRGAAAAARDIRYVVCDSELAEHRTLIDYREMLFAYLTEYIRQLEEDPCALDGPCVIKAIMKREVPPPRRRFKARFRRSISEWPLRPPRRP